MIAYFFVLLRAEMLDIRKALVYHKTEEYLLKQKYGLCKPYKNK